MSDRLPQDTKPMNDREFAAAWNDPTIRRYTIARMTGVAENAVGARARALGLGHKALPPFDGNLEANAPAPAAPGTLLAVASDLETATDWLYADLYRERKKHQQIEERLAILTPAGVLAECNARRLRHGLPPYVVAAI